MLTKKMLLMTTVMLGALMTANLQAQAVEEDLPLAVRVSHREPGAPYSVEAGETVQLLTTIEHHGQVGFAVSLAHPSQPMTAQNSLLIGIRPASAGDVVDWFGAVPPNLAGQTLRIRAIQLDKYGQLHLSAEQQLKVISSEDGVGVGASAP